MKATSDGSDKLLWDEFKDYFEDPIVQAFFRTLGLDLEACGVREFFDSLDVDKTGSIDLNTFVAGCTHFRGNAKLLDVEREARRTGLHDLEVRFSNDVADSIRLIEKRSSDFKAMFTVASKSNDKKYAKFAAEMAELWDIFEVRVREVTGRVEWLELKRKRGKGPEPCTSSGSSDGCGGKCVGDAFDEGSQSDDSQSHSGDSTRTLSTCDAISNGTNGSASAPGSGNVGCVDSPAACLAATVLVPVSATNDA
jgi:hypothetical protein